MTEDDQMEHIQAEVTWIVEPHLGIIVFHSTINGETQRAIMHVENLVFVLLDTLYKYPEIKSYSTGMNLKQLVNTPKLATFYANLLSQARRNENDIAKSN